MAKEKKIKISGLRCAKNGQLKGCFLLLASMLIPFYSMSQLIGIGADAQYNFQTEGLGAGARVSIFPNNRLSFVPQFSYYFPFNKVNEYYAGLALEYKFIRRPKFNIYGIAHGAYESWLNYEQSPMKTAKPTNLDLEAGIGISGTKRLRPYAEYRYNIRFLETHLRVGVLYIFGSGRGSRGYGGSRDRHCDAYRN